MRWKLMKPIDSTPHELHVCEVSNQPKTRSNTPASISQRFIKSLANLASINCGSQAPDKNNTNDSKTTENLSL